jgi:acyl dehydratase
MEHTTEAGVPVQQFPVEATHILMFARAIGDPNPAFVGSGPAEALDLSGVVAPPTFTMASMQFDPHNPLRPKPGEPWFGSGREPSGAERDGGGVLHAEQHFEYHQPVKAGSVLVSSQTEGEKWDKPNRRGDTLHFSETVTEYHDASTGDLMVRARTVRVRAEGSGVA